jgi:hypothetical protein
MSRIIDHHVTHFDCLFLGGDEIQIVGLQLTKDIGPMGSQGTYRLVLHFTRAQSLPDGDLYFNLTKQHTVRQT